LNSDNENILESNTPKYVPGIEKMERINPTLFEINFFLMKTIEDDKLVEKTEIKLVEEICEGK
jgi:hypothetical protein